MAWLSRAERGARPLQAVLGVACGRASLPRVSLVRSKSMCVYIYIYIHTHTTSLVRSSKAGISFGPFGGSIAPDVLDTSQRPAGAYMHDRTSRKGLHTATWTLWALGFEIELRQTRGRGLSSRVRFDCTSYRVTMAIFSTKVFPEIFQGHFLEGHHVFEELHSFQGKTRG